MVVSDTPVTRSNTYKVLEFHTQSGEFPITTVSQMAAIDNDIKEIKLTAYIYFVLEHNSVPNNIGGEPTPRKRVDTGIRRRYSAIFV